VIITANRVIHCNTDTPEEMHHWIGLLQKSKGDSRVDGQEFLVRGQSAETHSELFTGDIDLIYILTWVLETLKINSNTTCCMTIMENNSVLG